MKYKTVKSKRLILITTIVIAVAIATGFAATLLADKPADFEPLFGQWIRATGGYVLDIRNATPDGKLEAAYLNPNPINVSRAEANINNGTIEVLVELRDKRYPGNYYTLTYDRQTDYLVGIYHHLGVGQKFEVFFSRKRLVK